MGTLYSALLEKCGYNPRNFQVNAWGPRDKVSEKFQIAHDESVKRFEAAGRQGEVDYVAMLVDSEDPVTGNIEKPCDHLNGRASDAFNCPSDVDEEQVFLMATCMEAWIVADRKALENYYKPDQKLSKKRPAKVINEASLPTLETLETQDRDEIQRKLKNATAHCSNKYEKNSVSFGVLGKLNHCTLMKYLCSFKRMLEILNRKLDSQHKPCSEGTDTTDDRH